MKKDTSLENNNASDVEFDDEINLKELFSVLWARKIKIIVITAIFAVGSVFYALSIPNQYRAVALLAPIQSDSSLSSALSQLGGFTSLAVVSIGGSEASESQIAQEIMKSWSFIERFITENDLSVKVYAVEGWARDSNELIIDDDIYDTSSKAWLLEDDDNDETQPPTSWALYERFDKMLSVSENKKSGLVTVSIEYYSPEIAKEWLDMYVAAINKHMQERQVARVSNNIEYLEAQIEKTSIAEMREVFYTIIEEQTKNKMVAEASPDYVFVSVSPSMVPEKKSKPSRALICILVTLFGGMLSMLLTLLSYYTRQSAEN